MRSENAVAAAVERHNSDPLYLVQIVREAQAAQGWLSRETQAEIAERLKIPITRVESVVKFYSFFYDKPRGAYRLLISDNITDRMQGSQALFERLLGRFGVKRGEVSADGLVSVDLTSCTGLCDQGPGMLVNNIAVPRLSEARIDAIADLIEARTPLGHWPAEFFHVEDNVRRAGPLLQAPMTPGRALDAAIALGRQGVLDEMKRSNLRGRGGAGFATGLKWEAARNAPGADRYIVCNADEGEPGTFKDRVLLSSHPGRIFEGMAIAGYAIGATRGFLYLRGEYEYLKPRLDAELDRMRLVRRLGPAIRGCAGFDFDVEIHVGAGAYVCGEETALLESIEGKPGRPRVRPPFPATHGYLGRPTAINNVETLCQATEVVINGGAAFARARHQEFDRLEDSLRLRRLRAAWPVRVFLRRPDRAGARRRRRGARRRGGADQRPFRRADDPGPVHPPHRVRGRADVGRLHDVRRPTRPVRGRAQFRAFLRPRELRLLHALPGRHLAAAPNGRKDRRGAGHALRNQRIDAGSWTDAAHEPLWARANGRQRDL